MAGHDCGHDFSAAGNAVREMPGAYDERQHPGDHDLANGPVACSDHPCDQCDQPPTNHAFSKYEREMTLSSVGSKTGERVGKVWSQRAGFHEQPTEEHRTSDIGYEHQAPQAQSRKKMPALIEDEHYGKQCVLSEELSAANDDDDEPDRIEAKRDELCRRRVPEIAQCQRNSEPSESHSDTAGESRKEQCRYRTRELLASALDYVLEDLMRRPPRAVLHRR